VSLGPLEYEMAIRPIPLAALSLSFTAGCTNATLAGTWQLTKWLDSDGTDVTDSYLYEYTYDDCTYTYATRMILTQRASGFLFTYSGADCNGDEYDYSGGYGLYISGSKSGPTSWEFGMSYGSTLDCTLGTRLNCELGYNGYYYSNDASQTLIFRRL
jgi:hypothetical protein